MVRSAREAQGAVGDAFCRFDQRRQLLYFPLLASDDDDLKTAVVVKVNVLGRKDDVLKIVLDVSQFIEELALVMVIDDVYGTDHPDRVVCQLLAADSHAHQVFERFGPGGIRLSPDDAVECVEKFFVDGNTKPDK